MHFRDKNDVSRDEKQKKLHFIPQKQTDKKRAAIPS